MIDAVAFSNAGNIRSNHEDNYLLGVDSHISKAIQKQMRNNLYTEKSAYTGNSGVFAVCDGMGGHASGEAASYAAVSWLMNKTNLLLNSRSEEIIGCITELNTHICDEANRVSSCNNMGCTLSAILINGRNIHTVNAGDSRIYCFKNRKLSQITTDHTEGQRLLNLGLLTKDELPEFSSRKSLYKYLGRNGDLIADVADISGSDGLYMICSDGLTDSVDDGEIERVFRKGGSISDIGQELIDSALAKGNLCADNVTLLLVEISY